jgi:hypothetical protein
MINNHDRSVLAEHAIDVFAIITRMKNESLETTMSDLICDMMHLCKREGLSFKRIRRNAKDHFREERRGE